MVLLVRTEKLDKGKTAWRSVRRSRNGQHTSDRVNSIRRRQVGTCVRCPGEGVWSRDEPWGRICSGARIHANVGEVGPADASKEGKIVCFEVVCKGLDATRVNSAVDGF